MTVRDPEPRHPRGSPRRQAVPFTNQRVLAAAEVLANAPEWVLIAEAESVPDNYQTPTSMWAYRQGFEVARRKEVADDGVTVLRIYARHPFPVPEFKVIYE